MSWNYRIIRTVVSDLAGNNEFAHDIHEVYYGKDGRPEAWSVNPISVHGETLKDLKNDLKNQKKALKKPVLMVCIDDEGKESLEEVKKNV